MSVAVSQPREKSGPQTGPLPSCTRRKPPSTPHLPTTNPVASSLGLLDERGLNLDESRNLSRLQAISNRQLCAAALDLLEELEDDTQDAA